MGDHYQGDQGFCRVCELGDLEALEIAIENGVDVNAADALGSTGLMWALYNSHNNVVQVLLQQPDIDINKVNVDGDSALHFAVILNNHEGMAMLLERQDLTTINKKRQYPKLNDFFLQMSFLS